MSDRTEHTPGECQETDARMDRNLALEVVRATEAAAMASARLMGQGDDLAADTAAIAAVHRTLTCIGIDGLVTVGEGLEGDAPLLFCGQKVGSGTGPRVDLAIDALEGATIVARGGLNALSAIAMAEPGGFLDPPRVYMDKIAVGPDVPDGVVDLDAAPGDNLANLAKAKGVPVGDLLVCILDRPRHEALIGEVRKCGARVMLIPDGDVSAVIATAAAGIDVAPDIYMGLGGAAEGVLAAAALKCMGGQMQGRLRLRDDKDRAAAARRGITDFDRKYAVGDMARGEVMFAATGVTPGALLQGVRRVPRGIVTHSVVMRSKSGTVRFVTAFHDPSRGCPAIPR
ncbi:Fructose-1,6-bisphosphatase class 2 [uncultured Alphaproteobacteria bacterium]|uniref:Fructose-1,6-bisphosphatase n=1 Tax=uncultured Alphaproteobacteria bacterium TaxID=91750 RepID=A0A212JIL5_9PROT|nr:Fructose-1,6-bisphosphatase class 2 [uncultured Alphaproteobacteria bacterium]